MSRLAWKAYQDMNGTAHAGRPSCSPKERIALSGIVEDLAFVNRQADVRVGQLKGGGLFARFQLHGVDPDHAPVLEGEIKHIRIQGIAGSRVGIVVTLPFLRKANGTLSTYAYVNDAIARRTSMTKSGSIFQQTEVLSYTYNDRSEVTGAISDVNQNYSYSYAFDPIGNRTNATLAGTAYSYTANPLNQYTAVNTDTPTHDDDGNMLTNGAWTYAWNGENRLISAVNGTQRLEFAYDYMGRRIFKKVYSGETLTKYLKFVYDGYKLVEELDELNSDALSHRYVWQAGVGLDVPVSVYDTATDKTYFYHTDANKNITELTDNTDAVVAHYEYSPFGMQTVISGAFASDNPFRFSSEYYDAETGLVYYNYRYYNPQLGHWLSRDPIEEKGGLNLFGIVGNNPLGEWDYLGYMVLVTTPPVCAPRPIIIPIPIPKPIPVSLPNINVPTTLPGPMPIVPPMVSPRTSDNESPKDQKRLSNGEIDKMKDAGIDIHDIKGDKSSGERDLFKDKKGDIFIKPKDGKGPGEPTGLNIHDL